VSYASTALGHMRIDELLDAAPIERLDDTRELDAVAPGAKQGPYGPYGPASAPGEGEVEGEARAAGPAPGQHYVCAVPRVVLHRHWHRASSRGSSKSCGELTLGDMSAPSRGG
jgi:hypothetical protein